MLFREEAAKATEHNRGEGDHKPVEDPGIQKQLDGTEHQSNGGQTDREGRDGAAAHASAPGAASAVLGSGHPARRLLPQVAPYLGDVAAERFAADPIALPRSG